jgi:hypothetical protein
MNKGLNASDGPKREEFTSCVVVAFDSPVFIVNPV